jgi:hypothetical protein
MIDTSNRVMVIKYIDRAIDDAYKMGYRLQLGATLVDTFKKSVCPMGAVMITRPKNPLSRDFMRVFMRAFDGEVHKLYCQQPLAHALGLSYRRLLTT